MTAYRDRLTGWRVSIDVGAGGEPLNFRGQANNFQMPTLLEQFVEEPTGTGFTEKVFQELIATLTCTYELRTFDSGIAKTFGRPLSISGEQSWPVARFEAKTSSRDLSGKRVCA